jgi:hypothetical protein
MLRSARRRKSRHETKVAGRDRFWEIVSQHWPSIVLLHKQYANRKPVMLFDMQEQRVYAYPFKEFRAELSQRSQASLTQQYERALASGDVVVFIRDNEQQQLVSYAVPLPVEGRPDRTVRRSSE